MGYYVYEDTVYGGLPLEKAFLCDCINHEIHVGNPITPEKFMFCSISGLLGNNPEIHALQISHLHVFEQNPRYAHTNQLNCYLGNSTVT